MTVKDPRELAVEHQAAYDLGLPVDVERLAKNLGISIQRSEAIKGKKSERIDLRNGVIQLNPRAKGRSLKQLIALGIGQISAVRAGSSMDALELYEYSRSYSLELLMPREQMLYYWANGTSTNKMQKIFAVSEESLAVQLNRMGLI